MLPDGVTGNGRWGTYGQRMCPMTRQNQNECETDFLPIREPGSLARAGRYDMAYECMMANNNNYDSASCGPPSPHFYCSIPMADCKGNLTKIARPGRKTRGPRPRQSKNRSIAPRVHDRWVAGLMLAACTDSAEGHSGPLFVIPTGGRRPERRNLAANGRYVRFETRCLDSATLRST